MPHTDVISKIDFKILEHDAVGVMLMDIVDFTKINVGLGFDVGDKLLVSVKVALEKLLCGLCSVSNYFADKFILIFPNITDTKKLHHYANLVVNVFSRKPVKLNSLNIPIDLKVAYSSTLQGINGSAILQNLEWTMRELKRQNHDVTRVSKPACYDFDELYRNVSRYGVIRDALERKEFVNHYQPIVNLETHKITACESLVRWQNPVIGNVPPMSFLPHIDKHHQMIQLTINVVTQVISDFLPILKSLDPSFYVSVNIPPAIIIDTDAISRIINVINKSKFPIKHIAFELTEQHLLENLNDIVDACERIHKIGIKILIDDFGTGYSSIERIAMLPVHGIKVDKQFLIQKLHQQISTSILKFATDIAHRKTAIVICEGIATLESLNLSIDMGVSYGQGYLFSQPIDFEKFKDLLLSHADLLEVSNG